MAKLAVQPLDPEMLPGEFYVKDARIDCDLCRQTAPLSLARHYAGATGASYAHPQPCTPVEVRVCRDPVDMFPVEAIGYKLF